MDNEPTFFFSFGKNSYTYVMSASFHCSKAALAVINLYYTSHFKDTLYGFVRVPTSMIRIIAFSPSSLLMLHNSRRFTDLSVYCPCLQTAMCVHDIPDGSGNPWFHRLSDDVIRDIDDGVLELAPDCVKESKLSSL